MFTEADYRRPSNYNTPEVGWIEVIAGCMFSGKTEELIRRLNRAVIAKQKVEIFKPEVDTRYRLESIVSHNKKSIKCLPIKSSKDILSHINDCDVIGIDEAQFLDEDIIKVCKTLAEKGCRVIVAGLDMDYKGDPFGCIPQLMATAEYVTKVHAICAVCSGVASHSYRLSPSQDRIHLGEKESYEARCRGCFLKGPKA